jgi:hypothetical protein
MLQAHVIPSNIFRTKIALPSQNAEAGDRLPSLPEPLPGAWLYGLARETYLGDASGEPG